MKIKILNSVIIEKILFYFSFFTLGSMLLFFLIFDFNLIKISIIILIFPLILIPYILEDKSGIYIPPFFKSSFIIFVFSSLFLGGILGFYEKFWWWDTSLHFLSAIGLGITGFILIHSLTINNNIKNRKLLNFIFSLSFAVFLGVLWEFVEFSMDVFFNWEMQQPYPDTMIDLLVDTAGATIGAHAGFLYLSKNKSLFLTNLINDFFKINLKKKLLRKKDKLIRVKENLKKKVKKVKNNLKK